MAGAIPVRFSHTHKRNFHETLNFSESMAHQIFIENLRNARTGLVHDGFPRSFGGIFAHTWTNLLMQGFVNAWVMSMRKNDIYRSSGECMSVIFLEIEISVLNQPRMHFLWPDSDSGTLFASVCHQKTLEPSIL